MYKTVFTENETQILFDREVRCLSWAPYNGGIKTNIEAIANCTLTKYIEENKIKVFIEKHILHPNKTVVLLTTVLQKYIRIVKQRCENTELEITAFCTAGIGNALAIGDKASYNEELDRVGTINIIVIANKTLTLEAQLELSSIITMAKSQVMYNKRLISPISQNICLGTGTDCIAICSPNSTKEATLKYAGLYTKVAELAGRAVMSSLTKALDSRIASYAKKDSNQTLYL